MKNILLFIKSKAFFIHSTLILLFLFTFFFIIIQYLKFYTKHGDFTLVPDFSNQSVIDLPNFIENKDVSYIIIDSVFDPKEKKGIVLRQEPKANSKVKYNRTIYLYITSMVAPQIIMPKLIDRSERQAKFIIQTHGLKVGKIEEKPSHCDGCVIFQSIKGIEIKAGDPVKKGTVINLIIGKKDLYFNTSADSISDYDE
jgi:beta-lactam-binding protein with PASTA domain